MKNLKHLVATGLLLFSVSLLANPRPSRVSPPSMQKVMISFLKDNRINASRLWLLTRDVRRIFGWEITSSERLIPQVRFEVGRDLFECSYIPGELTAHLTRPDEYIIYGFRVFDCRNTVKNEDVDFHFNDTFTDGARFFDQNRRFTGLTWEEKYELLGGGNYGADDQVRVDLLPTEPDRTVWPEEAFTEIILNADDVSVRVEP